MNHFKSILHSYIKGEADLNVLCQEINRLAEENASSVEDALQHCEKLCEQGLLTTKAYNSLKQEVGYLQSRATFPNQTTPNRTIIDKTSVLNTRISQGNITDSTLANQPDELNTANRLDQDSGKTLGIGSILKNRFILEEVLGKGGMGMVYKARDLRKEETHDREPFVAIKVLVSEFQEHPISIIALQREAKKAQKLAHPNIITVYDFDRDGENVFMTMEYLEGEPLNNLIKRKPQKPLEKKRAISFIEQMSRALAYAHKRGIVHSDFKPGNVFVTKTDEVKVLDFGIARAAILPEQQGAEETVFDAGDLGALTPVYASKEMLERKDPDPSDDVYGLAVVAYQLLTGYHPFCRLPATNAQSAGLKPVHFDKLPRSIRNAIVHALKFERHERTANAGQFLQELDIRPRRKKSLKQRLFEIVFISVLALLTVYSINLFMAVEQPENLPEILLEETALISDPEIRQKVESLLEIAEVHMLVRRLMDPPGSSAYDAYHQVLKSHKQNRQANEGLRKIADYYENVARQSLDIGEIKKAGEMVEKGLRAFPAHEGLGNLNDEIIRLR